jgi:hypothetical protein
MDVDESIILFHSQFPPLCGYIQIFCCFREGLLDFNVLKLLQAQWTIK